MMLNRYISRYLLALFALLALSACKPIDDGLPRQLMTEWSEKHLIFVADSRMGKVRSYFLGNGAPVLFAQTRGVRRTSVRDLQLDANLGQLWVLGDDGVSLHDAKTLSLRKYFPVEAADAATLSINGDRVVLLDQAGDEVGRIDGRTTVAVALPTRAY
jgi:hypothetical protein